MEEMRRGASVVEGVRTISLVCPNGEAVTYDTTTDSSVTNLWNSTMAFGIIAIFPVVLIFIFMQKFIVSGLTNGAVKA